MNYREYIERAEQHIRSLPPPTSSGWARGKCPFCIERVGSNDRRGSFAFWVEKGFVRCFRCGVKLWLRGYTPPEHFKVTEQKEFGLRYAPKWFWPLYGRTAEESVALRPGIEYAESRGFDAGIRQGCYMGAAVDGEFTDRIIVPHRHADGSWWGFSARSWHKGAPMPHKYPTGMSRDYMFNQKALNVETDDPVLLEEGVLDGLLYWPDCVCALGKPIEAHIRLLKEARRPVAVVLDGDAHRQGEWFSHLLRLEGVSSGSVRLPPGRDPNDSRVNPADVKRAARACIGRVRPVPVQETCLNFESVPQARCENSLVKF